ncbi:hypothetical protein EDC01DRAFT_465622 [Geopyxis carbonaria]|nr:hypothetical protein EDC01DRAFT_465622 [Geopyxis carbonaria]
MSRCRPDCAVYGLSESAGVFTARRHGLRLDLLFCTRSRWPRSPSVPTSIFALVLRFSVSSCTFNYTIEHGRPPPFPRRMANIARLGPGALRSRKRRFVLGRCSDAKTTPHQQCVSIRPSYCISPIERAHSSHGFASIIRYNTGYYHMLQTPFFQFNPHSCSPRIDLWLLRALRLCAHAKHACNAPCTPCISRVSRAPRPAPFLHKLST